MDIRVNQHGRILLLLLLSVACSMACRKFTALTVTMIMSILRVAIRTTVIISVLHAALRSIKITTLIGSLLKRPPQHQHRSHLRLNDFRKQHQVIAIFPKDRIFTQTQWMPNLPIPTRDSNQPTPFRVTLTLTIHITYMLRLVRITCIRITQYTSGITSGIRIQVTPVDMSILQD